MLVDLAPTALDEPIRQLEVILGELRAYQPELLERPRLVVGSRADVAEAGVTFDGDRLSAVTGEGLESLVHALGGLVEIARSAPPERPAVVVHRPPPEDVVVERGEDGTWEVTDRRVARVANLNDLTNPCLLYTSPSPRDQRGSRMPSSA